MIIDYVKKYLNLTLIDSNIIIDKKYKNKTLEFQNGYIVLHDNIIYNHGRFEKYIISNYRLIVINCLNEFKQIYINNMNYKYYLDNNMIIKNDKHFIKSKTYNIIIQIFYLIKIESHFITICNIFVRYKNNYIYYKKSLPDYNYNKVLYNYKLYTL